MRSSTSSWESAHSRRTPVGLGLAVRSPYREMTMRKLALLILTCLTLLSLPMPAFADDFAFPAPSSVREIPTNGTTIHVRSAGTGPAVLLIHGYGETGDMW